MKMYNNVIKILNNIIYNILNIYKEYIIKIIKSIALGMYNFILASDKENPRCR